MAPQYKLTYFNSRGLAESARFIFAYSGVAYEDERFAHDDTWQFKKPNYTWGSLPVLTVDGVQLAQSGAILRYLGNKYNLAGDNDFESAKCDEIVEAIKDLAQAATPVHTEKDEAKKAELVKKFKAETIPKFFGQWNKLIAANGGFLVGKRFSYADFAIASYLQIYNEFFGGNLFDEFPALKSHADAVFALKGIKEWVATRPKTQF